MFQIIFNEISAKEMAALPKMLQLELLDEFHVMPENLEQLDAEKFGRVERDGRSLLRYRATDYRIYFEKRPEGVIVHRVLHKNTIRDFLYRSKLPMSEDEQLAETKAFWHMIEEAEARR
ncbi:MAG: hypothetical protein ABI615_06835 [Chthoniobacterales bacterium]